MKRQILKIEHKGKKFTVIFDDEAGVNKYALYKHIYEARQDGHGMAEHKHLVTRYAYLESALRYLTGAFYAGAYRQ